MELADLLAHRKDNPIYNTSYPLYPADWAVYKSASPLLFAEDDAISFYLHIPFCQHLCAFCEYTRMKCPDEMLQMQYLDTLEQDLQQFMSSHASILLNGFDIGGGTPTALCQKGFQRLMMIFKEAVGNAKITGDFEPSIEGTFGTVAKSKIQMAVDAGISRLSLGIQSTNRSLLRLNSRDSATIDEMLTIVGTAHEVGIKKINFDLMYGLKGQTMNDLNHDLEVLKTLHPEQITLYELRINMIRNKSHKDKAELYNMYNHLYDNLTDMGYHAHYGQNTFSLDKNDYGVSSYLRHRMLHATQYKGFGLSAQSMSYDGVSYNLGKGAKSIHNLLCTTTFENGDIYHLPKEEIMAKYIAISGYCNELHISEIERIIMQPPLEYFKNELEFLIKERLIEISGDIIRVTRQGYLHYGAVLSMLYYKPQ